MKLIIFFIFIPLVYSELHRFITTHIEIKGKVIAGIPEFSAVTTLDDQQIDYYDSDMKKLIPKQDWMKESVLIEMWKDYTKIREDVQQIYKNSIHVLMQELNKSHGLHTYQQMYGCEWDDETGESQGFDQHAYDGEDFIKLDLKEFRYIKTVVQAKPTVMKWRNDKQLELLKQYYEHKCVHWLKKFLFLSEATFKKADPPKVFVLQNKQGNYTCHVTGFVLRNTTISWRKNGQAMSDSSTLVETGDTFPNEDGTFQRKLTLYVPAEERKKNQYTCVVEHKSLNETIQKTMTVKKTSSSSKLKPEPGSYAFMHTVFQVIIPVIVVPIVLCGLWICWKKFKDPSKKKINYFKNKPSSPELPWALCPRIYNPSKKYSPPPEICIV